MRYKYKKEFSKVLLKMSGEQIILVGKWVKEKNDATLDELRQKLEKEANVVVSNSTISRILKRLNLTRKKKTIHASERYTERVQQERVEYWGHWYRLSKSAKTYNIGLRGNEKTIQD